MVNYFVSAWVTVNIPIYLGGILCKLTINQFKYQIVLSPIIMSSMYVFLLRRTYAVCTEHLIIVC